MPPKYWFIQHKFRCTVLWHALDTEKHTPLTLHSHVASIRGAHDPTHSKPLQIMFIILENENNIKSILT